VQNSYRGFAHIVLLIIVVFIETIGIVYLSYKNLIIHRSPTRQNKSPSSSFESPALLPTTNPTSTPPLKKWKTFVSSFGYSFQYPSEFRVFEEDLSGKTKNKPASKESVVVTVKSIEEESGTPKDFIVTFDLFNCLIPKQDSVFEKSDETINGVRMAKYTENPENNFFYTYDIPETGERLCIHPISDEYRSLSNQIISTFRSLTVRGPINGVDKEWKTVTNEKSKIQISFPPDFRSKIYNIDTKIGNGETTLSFFPEFQGSPCANAKCNNWKDVNMQIGNEDTVVRLIWPNIFGYFTFKQVVDHPYSTDSISIFASFPEENNLETINNILSTLKFLE